MSWQRILHRSLSSFWKERVTILFRIWWKPMTAKKHIQLILIICGCCICKFAYLLKCICNLQINQCSHAFTVICRHAEQWKLWHLMCMLPAEVEQGDTLSSGSSSHAVNKCLFQGLLKCHDFCAAFLCFWLVILLFKIAPGASPVAQQLRICLPTQGTGVRALAREDPTCRGATKPVRHNYWACALELACHNYWACVPQLLKPMCLEPLLHNKRSHHNEKPVHCNEE